MDRHGCARAVVGPEQIPERLRGNRQRRRDARDAQKDADRDADDANGQRLEKDAPAELALRRAEGGEQAELARALRDRNREGVVDEAHGRDHDGRRKHARDGPEASPDLACAREALVVEDAVVDVVVVLAEDGIERLIELVAVRQAFGRKPDGLFREAGIRRGEGHHAGV